MFINLNNCSKARKLIKLLSPPNCEFFIGKHAVKSELQTVIQSGLLLGVEGGKYLMNQCLEKCQQPTVTLFPDSKMQIVR